MSHTRVHHHWPPREVQEEIIALGTTLGAREPCLTGGAAGMGCGSSTRECGGIGCGGEASAGAAAAGAAPGAAAAGAAPGAAAASAEAVPGAAAAEAAPGAASAECQATATSVSEGGAAVAEGSDGWRA